MSERCNDCKEKNCIDTTCKTCYPKEDRAEYIGLMNGTLESLPRVTEERRHETAGLTIGAPEPMKPTTFNVGYYLDDKGLF